MELSWKQYLVKKKYPAYLWKRIREKSTVWIVNNFGWIKILQSVSPAKSKKKKNRSQAVGQRKKLFKLKIATPTPSLPPIITLLMVLPFVAYPKNNSCTYSVPMFSRGVIYREPTRLFVNYLWYYSNVEIKRRIILACGLLESFP